MSERPPRFPLDLAALLGLYWIVLPVVALAPSIFLRLRNDGDLTIFRVAIALGMMGVVLLFLARLPLYRERQYFAVGPRHLDARHRKLYWMAWGFLLPSIGILALILAAFR